MSRKNVVKRAILAVVLVVVILAGCMGVFVWNGLQDTPGHADAALVLGNKIEADGKPSARLRARLDKAVELYRAGWFPLVIVSGGIGKEGYDEAIVMRDYLVKQGIPGEHIITDNQGVTTYASAKNTAVIFQQKGLHNVFVVSQYFHIPRTRLALNRFGISQVYASHAHYFEWRDIYSTLRELCGYASYSFRRYEIPAGNTAPKA